jgi:hypothetical protein
MSSRMMTAILCFLTGSALAAVSFAAEEAPPVKVVATIPLQQELSMALDDVLKMINEGKKPNKDEIAAVGDMLQQNKKNLVKYDEPSKMKYHMLSAWISYFAGDMNTAVTAINAGLKNGPDDPDMKATYAAIALASEKYPMVNKLAVAKKPAKTKKRNAEMEPETSATGTTASGVLNFDIQAFKPQAISKKLSAMDTTYSCIGGTKMAGGKSDILCVLAWRSTAVKSKTASSTSMSGEDEFSRTQTSDSNPGAAFASLCMDYTGSGKVSFIGANFDPLEAGYNAMKEIGTKGWFWPQAMAQDPANKPLMELEKFETSGPTMAIIMKDGTIAYMGSPAGFLPKLLLAKATNDYTPKLFTPAAKADPNARRTRATDPNMARRRTADANSVHSKSGKSGEDDPLQMGSDIQAETLYNHAKSFLKGSRTTSLTAGPGVQACRQILQQYANTEWAAKARALLRDLPDELKTRYNITSEETGS